jgi:hypothetical protein
MIKREVTYRKGAAKKEIRILISHGMNIICMHCGNKCSKHTFYLMDSKIPLYLFSVKKNTPLLSAKICFI